MQHLKKIAGLYFFVKCSAILLLPCRTLNIICVCCTTRKEEQLKLHRKRIQLKKLNWLLHPSSVESHCEQALGRNNFGQLGEVLNFCCLQNMPESSWDFFFFRRYPPNRIFYFGPPASILWPKSCLCSKGIAALLELMLSLLPPVQRQLIQEKELLASTTLRISCIETPPPLFSC